MSLSRKVLLISSLITFGVGIGASAAPRVSGAGATFPSKIYTRWFADLSAAGGVRVNYQSIGSGSGRKAFIDETVDFAASDDPMKSQDIERVENGVVQIPMIGGTIAFGYNFDCDLKLTQENAVRIAMGLIKDWKELDCPAGDLTWVHRSDGSGTTKAFTASMQAFSETWTLGSGKSVKWPAGVGGKGNAGVAGVIRNTPGAIGYVNQAYVKEVIKAAALQNLSGEFLKPTIESGSIALNGIYLDENLAGENPNPSDKGAYPIATLTWILAYEKGNGRNAGTLQEVFRTLLSDSYQEKAVSLGFVPLKGDILNKSLAAIEKIGE